MDGMSAPAASISLLLEAVARGEAAGFERLYDLSVSRVYGVVFRVLRDPALAQETTQEVFLEVWRKAASFDGSRSSGWGWLLAIAHRRAVDVVRSNEASRARDGVYAQDLERAIVPGPEDETVARAERLRVRECMQSLTQLQRHALEMAYWDGLTHTQIAHELGAALGTVKSRLRDGVRALKRCLEPAGKEGS